MWSCVPLLIKQVAPPFDVRWVALLRLVMGAAFLVVAEGLIADRASATGARIRWRGRERVWLALGGAGIGGNYLLYTLGVARTTATAANLIVQVEVIGLALWGILILKEPVTRAKGLGMALCFSGVSLVAWNGESLAGLAQSRYLAGNLIIAAGGLSWSIYGLSQKVLLRSGGVAETVIPILVIGAGIAAIAAAFAPPLSRPPTALELAYLGALGFACTGMGYLLMVRGLRVMEASSVALVSALMPVFTMIEAHLLLGEELTGFILGGAALVVGGIALMVVTGAGGRLKPRRVPSEDAPA
ncbi:MAG: DMT family transporter [Armatimonadota bacterium]|nr:MAG: DMT family transporter [Armatimonadota bacterium]